MNVKTLQDSFRRVVDAGGDQIPLYFYAVLFDRHPELRAMFPRHMGDQRERLTKALVRIVGDLERTEDKLIPYLQGLGRSHAEKYRVRPSHYPMVLDALLATVAHFDPHWDLDLEQAWTEAGTIVANVMMLGAGQQIADPTPKADEPPPTEPASQFGRASWPAAVLGRVGYNPDEVDAYTSVVEGERAQVADDLAGLRAQVGLLEQEKAQLDPREGYRRQNSDLHRG